jgi:hypothetical protein
VNKNYYNADSVAPLLRWFEEQYKMSSEDFFEAHVANAGLPPALPAFHRHSWASFYAEVRAVAEPSFAESACRVLTGAC